MTKRPLRFLHTSDVHLGSHGYNGAATHHRHCVCPLLAIDRLAREHRVDGVLVVGDLFDHARVDETLVQRTFDSLEALPGVTLLIVGNHDVHDDSSLYRRHIDALDATSTVFFPELEGSLEHLLDGDLVVWGKAMDEHSARYRPLHGVIERPALDAWFMVLGHGLHVGDDPFMGQGRSSLITAEDIAATGADYVALGHHHVMGDVSTGGVTAFYSGAPTGYPGGHALLVELCPERGVSTTVLNVEAFATCPD